jgi:hypothetical protein
MENEVQLILLITKVVVENVIIIVLSVFTC